MKTAVFRHDPLLTLPYFPEEVKDYFGDSYLEDYGFEVPDKLVYEIRKKYDELKKLCQKLEKIEEKFLTVRIKK